MLVEGGVQRFRSRRPDSGHRTHFFSRRVRQRAQTAERPDEAPCVSRGDASYRAQHRDCDGIASSDGPSTRLEINPLARRAIQRETANPLCGILGVSRAKHWDTSLTQGDDQATNAVRRQSAVVEVAALDEDHRKSRGRAESIELRPESTRHHGRVKIANTLSLDPSVRSDGEVTDSKSCSIHANPKGLELLDDASGSFAMIGGHGEYASVNHLERMDETAQLI